MFSVYFGGREREQLINCMSEPVFAVVYLTTICTRCAALFVDLCCVGYFYSPQCVSSFKAISGNIDAL